MEAVPLEGKQRYGINNHTFDFQHLLSKRDSKFFNHLWSLRSIYRIVAIAIRILKPISIDPIVLIVTVDRVLDDRFITYRFNFFDNDFIDLVSPPAIFSPECRVPTFLGFPTCGVPAM